MLMQYAKFLIFFTFSIINYKEQMMNKNKDGNFSSQFLTPIKESMIKSKKEQLLKDNPKLAKRTKELKDLQKKIGESLDKIILITLYHKKLKNTFDVN